ncbi:MAG: type IV pilus biogenesis protein PilM [Polyangiales bacterium]
MARVLGLDIEDHIVRGVLVRTSFGRVEPLRYIEVPVRRPDAAASPEAPGVPHAAGALALDPAEPTIPGSPLPEVADPTDDASPKEVIDMRREAIAELFGMIRPPPDQIFVGLDGKEASVRPLELPAGAAKKGRLAEVLPFELDDLVPFDMDDTIVDYQPISGNDDVVRVMATAVPRERVAARIEELRRLGVDPRGMPVGAAALDGLTALVPELSTGGPHLIVEIERDNTEVCVLEDGACTFARSHAFGIAELGDERLQRRAIATLRRTLGAYRAGGGSTPVSSYLAGDAVTYAAQLSPLLAPLGEGLAFEPLPMPGAPGAEEFGRARFARAAALAGRSVLKGKRIDLRQGEFAQKRAMGELRQHARVISVCVAAILFSFIYATYARYSVLSSENERLAAQLTETTETIFGEGTSNVARAESLLQSGVQTQDPLPTMDAYDVLNAITAAIPVDIDHKTRRLTIEIDDEAREGRFDLQGTVASIAERDTVAANLESHECFRDLEKGPTSPGQNNEGLNYRLEVNIQCPGDEPPEEENSRSRRRRNRGNN